MPVTGIEAELAVFVDGERVDPARIWTSASSLMGPAAVEAGGLAAPLAGGGVLYFDDGVAEIVTPVIELGPGRHGARGAQRVGGNRTGPRAPDAVVGRPRARGPPPGVQHALQRLVQRAGAGRSGTDGREARAAPRPSSSRSRRARRRQPPLHGRGRAAAREPHRGDLRLHPGSGPHDRHRDVGGGRGAGRDGPPVVRSRPARRAAARDRGGHGPGQTFVAARLARARLPLPPQPFHDERGQPGSGPRATAAFFRCAPSPARRPGSSAARSASTRTRSASACCSRSSRGSLPPCSSCPTARGAYDDVGRQVRWGEVLPQLQGGAKDRHWDVVGGAGWSPGSFEAHVAERARARERSHRRAAREAKTRRRGAAAHGGGAAAVDTGRARRLAVAAPARRAAGDGLPGRRPPRRRARPRSPRHRARRRSTRPSGRARAEDPRRAAGGGVRSRTAT